MTYLIDYIFNSRSSDYIFNSRSSDYIFNSRSSDYIFSKNMFACSIFWVTE